MIIKQILAIVTVLICSCKEKYVKPHVHEKQIGDIVINLPENAQYIEVTGIDSYVAWIVINKDTLHAEYGKKGIINSLFYLQSPVFPLEQKDNILKLISGRGEDTEMYFSDQPEQDRELNIFDPNYWVYDTINSIPAKIVQPKKMGTGLTGIYLPALKEGNSFSIYGDNISPDVHRTAIEMFRTIRYK